MYDDGDAGADTVWVSGHGLSGLTEFSHCVLRLLAGFPSKKCFHVKINRLSSISVRLVLPELTQKFYFYNLGNPES
jgi:hypothetical protein